MAQTAPLRHLLAALLTLIFVGGVGQGATARTLTIRDVCVEHLEILSGKASASLPPNTVLTSTPGGDQTLTSSPQDCDTTKNSAVVTVPHDTAITIYERAYDTDINIAGVGGQLTATTNEGDLHADTVTDLNISLVGSGDATIGHVSGALTARTLASGDLTIYSAHLANAFLETLQSGDISIRGGMIDVLIASSHGAGDMTIDAPVRSATVTLSGSGDMSLASVSGRLIRTLTGSGALTIHDRPDVMNAPNTPQTPTLPPFRHAHHHLPRWMKTIILCVIVIAIARRRTRKSGRPPLGTSAKATWQDASSGYSAFVRNWEERMAEQRTRAGTCAAKAAMAQAGTLWGGLGHTTMRQRARYRAQDTTPAPLDPHYPLARLRERLGRLEPRLARLEHFVTSSDFALERQFRDLERS